jgi:hypothetical protein
VHLEKQLWVKTEIDEDSYAREAVAGRTKLRLKIWITPSCTDSLQEKGFSTLEKIVLWSRLVFVCLWSSNLLQEIPESHCDMTKIVGDMTENVLENW